MAKKQQKTSAPKAGSVSNLVVPIIGTAGEKHLLQKLIESKEQPILKAVGFGPLGPGDCWVSYTITTQGDKVLSIQISEPNLRQIAEECAKTEFVTQFMDQGL